jgi:hypothetical protein
MSPTLSLHAETWVAPVLKPGVVAKSHAGRTANSPLAQFAFPGILSVGIYYFKWISRTPPIDDESGATIE